LTIFVGSSGSVVVVARRLLASWFCDSSAIKFKMAGGSGWSKPVKKSEVFVNWPMLKVSTFEKLLPSVVTIFPGPSSTDWPLGR
jgi:hypothetical protein